MKPIYTKRRSYGPDFLGLKRFHLVKPRKLCGCVGGGGGVCVRAWVRVRVRVCVCVYVSLPRRMFVRYLIYRVIHQGLIPLITCFLLACTAFVLSFRVFTNTSLSFRESQTIFSRREFSQTRVPEQ